MKLVLDTNVFVAAFSRRSPHHWLFQRVIQGNITLCITTDILLEYEEVLSRMFGAKAAEPVVAALPDLPNVETVSIYFAWHLVQTDTDDNKFVDCAIAAGADALVTEDHHILSLKPLSFPPLTILSLAEITVLAQP